MSSPKLRLLAYSLVHVLIIIAPLANVWSLRLRWATIGLTSYVRVWLPKIKEGLYIPAKQVNVGVGLIEVHTDPSYLQLQLLKPYPRHLVMWLPKVNMRCILWCRLWWKVGCALRCISPCIPTLSMPYCCGIQLSSMIGMNIIPEPCWMPVLIDLISGVYTHIMSRIVKACDKG